MTNWKYQGVPQEPNTWTYLKEERLTTSLMSIASGIKAEDSMKKNMVEKLTTEIKESSMKDTTISWRLTSRKLTNMVELFYKLFKLQERFRRNLRRRYVYKLDLIKKQKLRRKMKERFISLRLVKLFYITFSYRQFRQLALTMRSKIGAFEENYLLALEGRLLSYLYRTSLMTNPFQCIEFIKRGNILINFRLENHYNFRVPINTLVTFSSYGKRLIYMNVIPRLKAKRTLFNVPKYMYLSYIFLYSYMTRPPRGTDLIFPVAIDMYRATGYAF